MGLGLRLGSGFRGQCSANLVVLDAARDYLGAVLQG